jgi:beta-mannosidase
MGDQPRYNVEVEVATDQGPSDVRSRSVGLRRVELRNWIFSINGQRLFLKGSNQGPTAMALGDVSASEFERDVRLAKEANLDFLRVHAHVSRPEFYDAADAQGLLLWQDLPLQWGYARGVRAQARRQAREAVDLLAHHPSVVVWCGHNEPIAVDPTPEKFVDRRQRRRLLARLAVGQFLPTWNKSVLDHSIASVLEKTDGSRPVVPHSGILPHPPQFDGTDSHWYFGWYQRGERDFVRLLRWWPRVARFVSEFGAQSVPDDASFVGPELWPDLDWDRAYRRHGLQKPFFDEHVPPARYATFDAWQAATQQYQAALIQRHIHALRLLKYRPAGGFAQFCLADSHPAVSGSVLAHDRAPKPAYAALRDACAPVIVLAGRLNESLRAGDRLIIPVYAINDRRISFRDMVTTLHLYWSRHGTTQHLEQRWQGELPADHAIRIGIVGTTVPMADGELALHVALHDSDGQPVSHYDDRAPVRT